MILCDTGVVVALVNKADSKHSLCAETTKSIREQVITTWPCLTEVMYLVGTRYARERVWQLVEEGFLHVFSPTDADLMRARVLMRKYADVPMDFADASLVAVAEALGKSKILTLDNHFRAYRIDNTKPLRLFRK